MNVEHGTIAAVFTREAGSTLITDALTGAEVLEVEDAAVYAVDDTAGQVSINDTVYDYIDVDLTNDTITLNAPGLTADAEAGDPVYLWNDVAGTTYTDHVAAVRLEPADESEETVEAYINHALIPYLPEGIRETGHGEAVELQDRGSLLYVTDIMRQTPTMDGTVIDPETLPDPELPTEPPAVSPAIEVTGTAEALVVLAEAVEASTTIEYHISTSSGFTPSAATLVTETRSSIVSIATLADGSRLEVDTLYYMVSVAKNVAGSAAPSTQVETQLDPDAVSNLVLAQVVTGLAMVGRLEVGGPNAYWDPDEGIVLPQPDGRVTRLTVDGVTPSVLAGFAILTGASIEGDLSLHGLSENFGILELADGVTDPTVAPTLSRTWPSVTLNEFGLALEWRGLAPRIDSTGWVVTRPAAHSTRITAHNTSGGVNFSGGPYGDGYQCFGIATVGSNYYVLGTDGNDWRVQVLDSAFVEVSTFTVNISPSTDPTIATDGTDLFVFVAQNSGNTVRVNQYSTAGTLISNATFLTHNEGTTFDIGAAFVGSADFGGPRYVINRRSGHDPYVFDSSGTRLTSEEWPRASGNQVKGLWWDGVRFYSLDNAGNVWQYASGHTAESTVHATYTWVDTNATDGTHETAHAPSASFVWPARSSLTIQGTPAPQEGEVGDNVADRVRLYAGPSSGDMREQATPAVGTISQTFSTALATGTALAPTSNTFTGTEGATGTLRSGAEDGSSEPLTELRGDGYARAAKLIQSGTQLFEVASATTKVETITFPVEFDTTPNVTLSTSHRYWVANISSSPSTTGVDVRIYHVQDSSQSVNVTVYWIATTAT